MIMEKFKQVYAYISVDPIIRSYSTCVTQSDLFFTMTFLNTAVQHVAFQGYVAVQGFCTNS